MKATVLPGVIAAIVAVAALGGTLRPRVRGAKAPRGAPSSVLAPSQCPPGTLPDDGVCIPVPPPPRAASLDPLTGHGIPRRPDRDSSYERYVLPVLGARVVAELAPTDGGVARDGVAVRAPAGARVVACELDGQVGPARVVYAGALVGSTVITEHTIGTASDRKTYLVVLGNLRDVAVAAGADVAAGAPVGTMDARPLHLDARLVRPDVDARRLSPPELLDDARTIPVDPRNVLKPK